MRCACNKGAKGAKASAATLGHAYSTDCGTAATAVAHHVSGAKADSSAREVALEGVAAIGSPGALCLEHPGCEAGIYGFFVVGTTQRVLDELSTVEKEIGAKLPTCCGKVMKGVEVEVLGYCRDDPTSCEAWTRMRDGSVSHTGSMLVSGRMHRH